MGNGRRFRCRECQPETGGQRLQARHTSGRIQKVYPDLESENMVRLRQVFASSLIGLTQNLASVTGRAIKCKVGVPL